MTWTKENMFGPSGCLTREAFGALVNGTLPAGAIILANEHIASCPFCSDALEGFESQKAELNFSEIMATTDAAFDNMMEKSLNKSGRKRIILLSISAAASVLLIVGLFYLISTPNSKMQVAESISNKDTSINKPVEETPKTEDAKVVREKQPIFSPKGEKPEKVKNTVRFTPPDLASEEVVSEPTQVDNIKGNARSVNAVTEAEPLPIAEKVAPPANEELKKEDEQFADKKEIAKPELKSYFSATSAKKASNKGEEPQPLTYVEQMPEFPGGQSAMTSFLNQNLQYPKLASEMGISGKVYVQFTVDEQGNIGNIKILRGLGAGCDEEAIRVVKLMPKWLPGKQNGSNVKTYFTLQIIFNLQGK